MHVVVLLYPCLHQFSSSFFFFVVYLVVSFSFFLLVSHPKVHKDINVVLLKNVFIMAAWLHDQKFNKIWLYISDFAVVLFPVLR